MFSWVWNDHVNLLYKSLECLKNRLNLPNECFRPSHWTLCVFSFWWKWLSYIHLDAVTNFSQDGPKKLNPRITPVHRETWLSAGLKVNLSSVSGNMQSFIEKKKALPVLSGRLGTCLSSQLRKMTAPATHAANTAPVIMITSKELG